MVDVSESTQLAKDIRHDEEKFFTLLQEHRKEVDLFVAKIKEKHGAEAARKLTSRNNSIAEETLKKAPGKSHKEPWPSPLVYKSQEKLLLNSTVLSDVVKEKKLKIFCCTWNLNAKSPSVSELERLLPLNQYHIYAIGTQECEKTIAKSAVLPSKKAWERKIQLAIGETYIMVRSHTLQANHLAVYAHKEIIPIISKVSSSAVATGFIDMLGNKAHQDKVQQRNENFHRIDTNLTLPDQPQKIPECIEHDQQEKKKRSEPQESNSDSDSEDFTGMGVSDNIKNGYLKIPLSDKANRATQRFDRVFWMGDLNYRINGTREAVDKLLRRNDLKSLEKLLEHDQLNTERKKGHVFAGFQEGPLHFHPTYKYDNGTNDYDTSKKRRIPSWTDRILFYSAEKRTINILEYRSIDELKISDHKPVVASFDACITHETSENNVGSPLKTGEAPSQVCTIS